MAVRTKTLRKSEAKDVITNKYNSKPVPHPHLEAASKSAQAFAQALAKVGASFDMVARAMQNLNLVEVSPPDGES